MSRISFIILAALAFAAAAHVAEAQRRGSVTSGAGGHVTVAPPPVTLGQDDLRLTPQFDLRAPNVAVRPQVVAPPPPPRASAGDGGGGSEDSDGDGSPDSVDCSDWDASVRPGAVEIYNGRDDNCDGYAS